jgi:hypothetical protein
LGGYGNGGGGIYELRGDRSTAIPQVPPFKGALLVHGLCGRSYRHYSKLVRWGRQQLVKSGLELGIQIGLDRLHKHVLVHSTALNFGRHRDHRVVSIWPLRLTDGRGNQSTLKLLDEVYWDLLRPMTFTFCHVDVSEQLLKVYLDFLAFKWRHLIPGLVRGRLAHFHSSQE